ncbi:hypothetical protein RvY_01887 [Ramazzottius varieornatus]|uniref:Ras-associating domain-containing protein n=1 Tax=Ramazzottius varieornatus TaxID=947166 RepID=A0A1D1UT28_RAMVA|nr:hypothetical protein RvY_01887 [Ramazzottius varieornatus]
MFKHIRRPSRVPSEAEDGQQPGRDIPRCPTALDRSFASVSSGKSSVGSDSGSSRSSSALSTGDAQTGVIKVYCGVLRPDVDYKTLFISNYTSSRDVVEMLLRKCKIRNRDANLYYLTMDISLQCMDSGTLVTSFVVLEDEAQPLDLKTCQPTHSHLQFTLRCKEGGLLKVHDSCLNQMSRYKSLLIAEETTVEEVIRLLLSCHDSSESPDDFLLSEVLHVEGKHDYERALHPQDMPLLLLQAHGHWPNDTDTCSFHLRRAAPLLSSSPFFSPSPQPQLDLASAAHDLINEQMPQDESRLTDDHTSPCLLPKTISSTESIQEGQRFLEKLLVAPTTVASCLYGKNVCSDYQNYVYI